MNQEQNGNIEELLRAGRKRGISNEDTMLVISTQGPDQIVRNLRRLGYTFAEIADFDGRSSQWMSHLSKGLPRPAAPIMADPGRQNPEAITRGILMAAANDMTWWSPDRGRMIQEKVVGVFRENGYTWKEARRHDINTRADKLTVILMFSFGIGPDSAHIKEWFRVKLETLTKDQIFDLINQGQTLKITERAYVRAWNRFGLHVKIRKPRKTKV